MTNKTATIAAVVVTFNRKVLLIECLNALLAQTRPMDKIYLIDNASSDGTQALLEEQNLLNHPLIDYRLMTENLGGAGGFYEGIKAAHEDGYDWIWVMDDDAEPWLDAAEKLEPYFTVPDTVAVCPIVKDANNNELTIPHHGWFNSSDNIFMSSSITSNNFNENDALQIDKATFVGLCIASSVISIIGLPKREFFIHYDDTEFCSRINSIGQILLIKNSVIKHKEAAKTATKIKYIFGIWRGREVTPHDKLWIKYFPYRNYIWLITHQNISTIKMIMIYLLHFKKLIGVFIYEDNKSSRIKFWNAAFFDGINGNFDNKKPYRILNKIY